MTDWDPRDHLIEPSLRWSCSEVCPPVCGTLDETNGFRVHKLNMKPAEYLFTSVRRVICGYRELGYAHLYNTLEDLQKGQMFPEAFPRPMTESKIESLHLLQLFRRRFRPA